MSSVSPLVSVCIANYNGELILKECVDSVLAQDYKNIEIIIHDDFSTDDSINVIKEYEDKVQLIESSENVGFCISNNRMVAEAAGKYILLFNNDAVLEQTAITCLTTVMEETSYGILTLIQKDYNSSEIIDSGRDLDIFLNPVPRMSDDVEIQKVMTVHGACLFISKKLWNNLGGFPDYFQSVAEDLYLCLAAQANGIDVGSVNTSFYLHRNGYSFGGGGLTEKRLNTTYTRRYLSERNKLLTMNLLYPNKLRFVQYLLIILLIIEGGILSLLKFDNKILFNVYIKAMRDYFNIKRSAILKQQAKNNKHLSVQYISKMSLVPYKLKLLIKFGIPKVN